MKPHFFRHLCWAVSLAAVLLLGGALPAAGGSSQAVVKARVRVRADASSGGDFLAGVRRAFSSSPVRQGPGKGPTPQCFSTRSSLFKPVSGERRCALSAVSAVPTCHSAGVPGNAAGEWQQVTLPRLQ